MGRKIKPLGLRRKAVSISLPLDVISWLDKIVLSKEGGTRSRTIEGLLRNAMTKGQATLTQIFTHWECSACGHAWSTKDLSLEFVFCSKCTKLQDKHIDMKGQGPINDEEEE